MNTLVSLSPLLLALGGGLFTWGMTAVGAAAVFFARDVDRRVMDAALGFAAGVMLAASCFSLLLPALALSRDGPLPVWLPATVGFLAGGAFLWALDRLVPHLHLNQPATGPEGPRVRLSSTTLLFLALTLHNFPEGVAVGVAFGATGQDVASLAGAATLTLGIGVQNLPEGLALALPLRREGLSVARAFLLGQASGIVEPVGAVLGAAAVTISTALLPYALGFAAGAMVFVVIEELLPEAQAHGDTDLPTLGAMVGFAGMMVLDTAFV
ncbi:MAG: ZIP family metal transporter [Myxococcota bacterium]